MLRLFFIFLIVTYSYSLKAQGTGRDILVTFSATNKPLTDIINELGIRYPFNFYYSSSKIDIHKLVTIRAETVPFVTFMDMLKHQAGFDYKISNGNVILFPDQDLPDVSKMVLLHGFVQDSQNGEKLIGANIIFPELKKGTTTNAYGYFNYALTAGKYRVQCSNIGFSMIDTLLEISGDQPMFFYLKSTTIVLKEVKLISKPNDKITSIRPGYDDVPIKMLRLFPTLFGEKDALQFIKFLPGIRSCNEGSTGLYIRGSTQNQTTFMIDDAPMFNMYHISGIFSTINPDAIKDLNIYKCHLPTRTGGPLSSLVDIRLRDGNNQQFAVTGGIGTITSRITIEGPIAKGKASFIISGRRSYLDELLNVFHGLQDMTFFFYDLNAKLNYTINSRNRVYLSGYLGKDYFNSNGGTKWGNSLFTFRWNRVINQKVFSNIILTNSSYWHTFFGNGSDGNLVVSSKLKNIAFKYDFTFTTVQNWKINFGINSNYIKNLPTELEAPNFLANALVNIENGQARFIHQLYADAALDFGQHWGINAGLRLSVYQNPDVKTHSISLKPEPLLSVKYQINPQSSVKLAYSRNYQFYHGASIFEMIIPFDKVFLADSKLPPQFADHISCGYFFRNKNETLELSAETYYSRMHRQYRFELGDQVLLENSYYNQAVLGEVNAYGFEFSLRKQTGRFTGMLGYTLSKVNRKEPEYNNDKSYSPYYDRRHDLSINLGLDVSRRVNLSVNWVLMSGNPYNLPIGKYEIRGRTVPLYSTDNTFSRRMPVYHRMDAGCQVKLGNGKRFHQSLSFNIYNVYAKGNPVYYYYREVADKDLTKNIETSKYSTKSFNMISQYIFTFVPSFSYEFKFE